MVEFIAGAAVGVLAYAWFAGRGRCVMVQDTDWGFVLSGNPLQAAVLYYAISRLQGRAVEHVWMDGDESVVVQLQED